MRLAPALLFVATTTSLLAAADDDAVAKEFKSLAGTWKLVSVEEGGKAVPKDDLPAISFTLHADGKSTVKTPGGEFQTQGASRVSHGIAVARAGQGVGQLRGRHLDLQQPALDRRNLRRERGRRLEDGLGRR